MKELKKRSIFATAFGEMAEWSNAAVLKTVEGHTSGGSNPSFSAKTRNKCYGFSFLILFSITNRGIFKLKANFSTICLLNKRSKKVCFLLIIANKLTF